MPAKHAKGRERDPDFAPFRLPSEALAQAGVFGGFSNDFCKRPYLIGNVP